MKNRQPPLYLWTLVVVSFWLTLGFAPSLAKTPKVPTFLSPMSGPSLTPTPFFRFPVVPNAEISGYLDHNDTYPPNANHLVTFYNGRKNTSPSYGYTFYCPSVSNDFVGCEGPYSGEAACPNYQELWYDGHSGTDFEYAADWHEPGDTCNLSRFAGIIRPIYAPAPGIVQLVQTNHPANGNAIFIKHDLNGDGNYNDDIIRSAYLHFKDGSIQVSAGQSVNAGQYLGSGDMTGKAYTPHLHFEVQRATDANFTNKWPVDPLRLDGPG